MIAGDLGAVSNKGIGEGLVITAPTFPSRCRALTIQVTAGGAPINNGDCVFITDMPAMPNLTAKIVSGGVNGTVNWQLIISYTRNGRQDYDTITASLSAPESWDITAAMGTKIRGGQAMLICHALDSNWYQSLSFGIRAYNAPENVIIVNIANIPDALWYYVYVAKHEGGEQAWRWYLQFNEIGAEDCGPGGVRYTPNASGDGGFGLFQLTFFGTPGRAPNAQELWNWKENVTSGTGWLTDLQTQAYRYMLNQHSIAYVDQQVYVPVPDDTVAAGWGTIVFSDAGAEALIDHAVAIKRYNGLGVVSPHHYCVYNELTNKWDFYRWALYYMPSGRLDSINYVAGVCSVYP